MVIGIALLTGAWTAYMRLSHPSIPSDLEVVLLGVKAWLAGHNPYETVVASIPGANVPLMYPFPALVMFAPFVAMPAVVVDVLWTAVGAGCLAWALTSEQLLPPSLAMFLSTPFVLAIQASQWTPQVTAAALLPWGGWLFACKPTTGLWLFAYRPTWRHVITASMAMVVSLALWPAWPFAWRAVLGRLTVATPVMLPGGILVLLALLRWRRPEARMLATMAIVPHSTLIYETLPLFLVPATWIEAGILWIGTVVVVILHDALGPYATPSEWLVSSGRLMVWCVYLPALVMILRRPNVSRNVASVSRCAQISGGPTAATAG